MEDVVVGVLAKLSKPGASDIGLLIHSYYVGHPSPCYVIENGVQRDFIGGHIESLDEILALEVQRHPGFSIAQRTNVVVKAVPEPKKTRFTPPHAPRC